MATNSNAVTLFNPGQVPAHIADFFDGAGSNIQERTTVNSLSPQGKMWTISLNGTKTKLERKNNDGDMEAVGVMKVVILDYNQRRGRAYYEGEYDPAKESAPVCWSADGIKPDDSLPPPIPVGVQTEPGKQRKICETCAACPMSVKGSKITAQNKAVTACGQHRMLAVVPAFKLDFPPLRMKIAMTSDYDAQSPDQEQQGWMAFSNYVDWLKARGVKHTGALVTKMKFDPNAAYPKIFFSADRWLEDSEKPIVLPLTKDESVKKLLGRDFTPAGVDGVPTPAAGTVTPAPVAQPAIEPVAQPAAIAPKDGDIEGEIIMSGLNEPAPSKADEAPASAIPSQDVSTDVPDDIKDLLTEWTD